MVPIISVRTARCEVSTHNICVDCGRQFIDVYTAPQGYSDAMKALCLKMYVNGMGNRCIERVTGVHHTTVISWGKQVGENLPDAYEPDCILEVGELSGVRNVCQSKKNQVWLWTAVDHFKQGILGWVLGAHSAKTFEPLWTIVANWQCYFGVTHGWSVYPGFIPAGDQIVSKTYMTRVEGENTRWRHYLARLHRQTLCYSLVRGNVETLERGCYYTLLKFWDVPLPQ